MVVKKKLRKPTGTPAPAQAPTRGREGRSTLQSAKRANRRGSPQPQPKTPRTRGGLDDLTGFSKNSDQNTIAHELMSGGSSRKTVTDRVTKKLGTTTSTGSQRNTASQITSTIRVLEQRGFRIDSHFKLLPPEKVQKTSKKSQ